MALVTWDWMLRPLPMRDEDRRPPRRPLTESLGSLTLASSDEDERQPQGEERAHGEHGACPTRT